MQILYPQSAEDSVVMAKWAAHMIPHMNGQPFDAPASIAFLDDAGEVGGMVVYSSYQPQYGNIQVSFVVANPKCLSRNLLSALLRYPFTQLGVQRVTAITPSDETTSVWRFLQAFGFTREGRVRRGLGTEGDAIIWGLLASEWRTNKFNVDREPKKRRRRKRGTLSLESHALH